MDAGPELDALVATKVMGWHSHPDTGQWLKDDQPTGWVNFENSEPGENYRKFSPSTSIADAWVVIGKLHQDGGWTDVKSEMSMNSIRIYGPDDRLLTWHFGESAPRAICIAALKAVAVSDQRRSNA